MIRGANRERHVILPVELVPRGSTGPVPLPGPDLTASDQPDL
ncbi:hypothetical protein [Streptomyces sp. NPDC055099]